MTAAVLLAHLALAQLPYATQLELSAGERVELAADHLTYDAGAKVITVRGHCVLRAEKAVLRADEISYREADGRAVARGRVTLAMGLWVALADEIDVDVATLDATLQGALLVQKREAGGMTPEALRDALRAAETPEAIRALGQTALAFRGRRIQRLGPNRFAVDGLAFTPCDCDLERPSWRIEAARADVEPGERATLTWPVVSVYGVPVLFLPWAYLPLADRRSGLLVPRPDFTYLSGLSLEQPLFLTLGESADVTFTPGYAFGGASQQLGVEGPRLKTEVRYVPSIHASGRALLSLLYDLRSRRHPVDPALPPPGQLVPGRRGLRFEAALQHVEDLGRGLHARVDLSAVSDGYYVRDLTPDVLLRETRYLRSTASLAHRGDDHLASLEVVLRQDVRHGYALLDARQGPRTLQRLPALGYALLDRPLWGPLRGSFTAEYSRVAPAIGWIGDEGTDGIFDPLAPDRDGSQGDRRLQDGEREARDRLDLRSRLSAPLRLGDVARVTPYLAYRRDLYLGEITGRFQQRGYALGGVAVDSELSRTFAGGTLRHTIAPSVELRAAPWIWGAPLGLYDELDAAVPQGGLLQAVAEVGQRLLVREDGRSSELLRLDLAQGYDVLERRPGDTAARFAFRRGWVGADGTARYCLPERRLTQLSAGAGVDDGQGHGASARYQRLMIDGSDRQRRGADALVGPASSIPVPDPSPASNRAELLTAAAWWRFPAGFSLRYDAILSTNQPAGAGPLDLLTQQTLNAGFTPSCDCWRLDLSVSLTHRAPGDRWLPGWGIRFSSERLGKLP